MAKWLGNLIRVCALVGISTFLSVPAHSTEPAKRGKYLVGLELYTVRDDCAKDFEGVLKSVAKMGFTGVEFAGYYGRSAEELRKWLDEDGLKCYGTHTGFDQLLGDNLEKTIKFNETLGNHLIVVPSLPGDRRDTKAHLIETAKLFGQIAEKLKSHNIMLGYHNHMDEFKPMEGELPWEVFFGNTGSQVMIQFDTGNAMAAGAQAAPFLLKYPKRVVSIHVKDFSSKNPNALLGEGDENWDEVIPIFQKKLKVKWYIIEQETYPVPAMECAEKCLRSFEAMMDKRR